MNKAVELFRRHQFRAVALLGFATLAGFLLLNTVGFLGSSWDACEDARMRRGSAKTDTMFKSARDDVKKFCEPDETWATPTPIPTPIPTLSPESQKERPSLFELVYGTSQPTPSPTWPPTATPVPLKVGSTASIITGRGTQMGHDQVIDCDMVGAWTSVAQGTKVTIVDSALSCDPWPDRYQVRLPDGELRWFEHDQLTQ
jgi:hypothetical protein